MPYDIGELDQKVSLQSPGATPDGMGGQTVAWTEYAEVWALVRPVLGRAREREHALRVEGGSDYIVAMRYRSDVKDTHRIVWGERVLNVRFVRLRGAGEQIMEVEAELGAAT